MVAAPSVDPHFRLLRSLAASTASRVCQRSDVAAAVYGGSFVFAVPLLICCCFLLLGGGWFHTYLTYRHCACIHTHTNLGIAPCSHQTTPRERRMTRKGIAYTALRGNFFDMLLLAAICCGVSACSMVLHSRVYST